MNFKGKIPVPDSSLLYRNRHAVDYGRCFVLCLPSPRTLVRTAAAMLPSLFPTWIHSILKPASWKILKVTENEVISGNQVRSLEYRVSVLKPDRQGSRLMVTLTISGTDFRGMCQLPFLRILIFLSGFGMQKRLERMPMRRSR